MAYIRSSRRFRNVDRISGMGLMDRLVEPRYPVDIVLSQGIPSGLGHKRAFVYLIPVNIHMPGMIGPDFVIFNDVIIIVVIFPFPAIRASEEICPHIR